MGKVIRMLRRAFTHGVDPHAIERIYHVLGSHLTYCPQCDRFHSDGCAPWRAKRA